MTNKTHVRTKRRPRVYLMSKNVKIIFVEEAEALGLAQLNAGGLFAFVKPSFDIVFFAFHQGPWMLATEYASVAMMAMAQVRNTMQQAKNTLVLATMTTQVPTSNLQVAISNFAHAYKMVVCVLRLDIRHGMHPTTSLIFIFEVYEIREARNSGDTKNEHTPRQGTRTLHQWRKLH